MMRKPPVKTGLKTIQFFLPGPPGMKVYWVGDYNHWATRRRLRYSAKNRGYSFKIKAKPDGIYFYKYVINGQWVLDPNNPNRYDNGPFGTNSYVTMPRYRMPLEIFPKAHVPKGYMTCVQVPSSTLRTKREVFVYTPHGYEQGKDYPLLVMQDGRECVEIMQVQTIFDNLIHEGVCRPLVCALVSPRSPHGRDKDYVYNQGFEQFLAVELMQWLKSNYRISPKREDKAIFGYSLGGLVSVRTAVNYPHVFGLAGGESSAFWPRQGAIFHEVIDRPPFSTRFYLGCGDLDGGEQLSYIMADLFRHLGVHFHFKLSVGGHDWFYWKTHLRHSLQWFFPAEKR